MTALDVRSGNGFGLVNIRIHRGGTEIFVSASNGVSTVTSPEPGRATTLDDNRVGLADLPLTVDELIAVAAVPQLQLFR